MNFLENGTSQQHIRESLLLKGVLRREGDGLKLTRDALLETASVAVAVIAGGAENGRDAGRDRFGRMLKEIAEAATGVK